ncbi:hypothetical protein [Stieleria varia]|uniref:Uncharacterized protein n=1 Tax=Stieleria varia TaxID=2528005 RepID=A0A5C6A3J7_9BACT|nr:hypothetical protein [Stieleria varia]TWT94482.1 hypothetical protein Pla52n_53030 [Stieleria varia]
MTDCQLSEDSFQQSCEVCGRPAIISNQWAGKRVGCRHCGGTFTAKRILPGILCQPTQRGSDESALLPSAKSWTFRLAASVMTAISNLIGEIF